MKTAFYQNELSQRLESYLSEAKLLEYDDLGLVLHFRQPSHLPQGKFQIRLDLSLGSLPTYQVNQQYLRHLYGESYHELYELLHARSEERRVGKECSARGSRCLERT